MNQLNSLILEGNIVKDAELSEPMKGFKVCKFSLAVNRFAKKSSGESFEEVSFFDIETYGKTADYCEKNGTKGRSIRVVGRLKQNRWKDTDGKSQSKILIIAEHIEFKPVFQNSSEKSSNQTESKFENQNQSMQEEVAF
ncbi:MAG: single-stranded DNA-binding protein [Treponema sp.]|jgi:single-strand DNA-binding protein|nr:single-stranded DNA-binding protein [Treponema sp.]